MQNHETSVASQPYFLDSSKYKNFNSYYLESELSALAVSA